MPRTGTPAATTFGTRLAPPGNSDPPLEAQMQHQGPAGPGLWARDHACWWLPGTPWWARAAGTPDGCGALELYEGGELLDVVVDTPVAPRLLRGARRAGRGDQAVAVAWGRVPVPGGSVAVRFTRGRPRSRTSPGWFAVRTTWCWIALAAGGFSHAVAAQADTRQRCAIARARACLPGCAPAPPPGGSWRAGHPAPEVRPPGGTAPAGWGWRSWWLACA